MNLLLIRHADWQGGKTTSKHAPLSETGRLQTRQRGALLVRMGVKPQLYLTIPYRHVRQMAELLANQLGEPHPRIISLDGLRPNQTARSFEHLADEARKQGVDLQQHEVVAILGHEETLSRLHTRLTGRRTRPFDRAEIGWRPNCRSECSVGGPRQETPAGRCSQRQWQHKVRMVLSGSEMRAHRPQPGPSGSLLHPRRDGGGPAIWALCR